MKTPEAATPHQPSEFERFKALATRILTTPKAELAKDEPKPKASKPAKKK